MGFTSNKKDKPTVIDGVPMPPGVAPSNATMTLRTNPKTGKREWVTKVHIAETVTAGRTTINHIPDGPITRKETEEINAAHYRNGLPVIKTTDHVKTSTPAALPQHSSELARSLGADANKPGAAKKAGNAYAAEQEEKRRADDPPRVRTQVSVVEPRGRSTVKVPVNTPGPKMDRS